MIVQRKIVLTAYVEVDVLRMPRSVALVLGKRRYRG